MKFKVIDSTPTPVCKIVFLGWGTDHHALSDVSTTGLTIAVWDYTNLKESGLPPEVQTILQSSRKINVVAWSLGVWAAETIMHQHPEIHWGGKVALSGTPYAVHGNVAANEYRLGIPIKIAQMTADNWNEATRNKFNIKMFGADPSLLGKIAGERSIEDQKTELEYIIRHGGDQQVPVFLWDMAYVSCADRIFPPTSQSRYWSVVCKEMIEEKDMPHYPFALHNNLDNLLQQISLI